MVDNIEILKYVIIGLIFIMILLKLILNRNLLKIYEIKIECEM